MPCIGSISSSMSIKTAGFRVEFQWYRCSQFYSDWRASKINNLAALALPREGHQEFAGQT
jgi:hypothetical protein